ncbi:hypothetical protein KM043_009130 [Ampulex compressa]|nr:hypothetical protein KM043_009130 [Ampulex compressa]
MEYGNILNFDKTRIEFSTSFEVFLELRHMSMGREKDEGRRGKREGDDEAAYCTRRIANYENWFSAAPHIYSTVNVCPLWHLGVCISPRTRFNTGLEMPSDPPGSQCSPGFNAARRSNFVLRDVTSKP